MRPKRQQTDTFAAGCSPYKIILLFFIGAFLGDITETIFCRVTGGEWMSRSSVVWGPFSIVWGLAIAMVTQLLYRYKDKPASWLFVMGTLLGGAYEYLCSVFTEVVFGAVFWDYSAIPFNLAGASTCCTASSGLCGDCLVQGAVPADLRLHREAAAPRRQSADLGTVHLYGGGHCRQLRRACAVQ